MKVGAFFCLLIARPHPDLSPEEKEQLASNFCFTKTVRQIQSLDFP
jgi:hypothetical protein